MQPLISNISLNLDNTVPVELERKLQCALHFIGILSTMLRCSNAVVNKISSNCDLVECLCGRLQSAQSHEVIGKILETGKTLTGLKEKIIRETKEAKESKERGELRLTESINDFTILPSELELRFGTATDLLPLKNTYTCQEEYLYTQFHLLREDFVQPLFKGLREYRVCLETSTLKSFKDQNARLYRNVRCVDFMSTVNKGIQFDLDFSHSPQKRKFESPKRLIPGSLVLASSDGFMFEILILIVSDRRDLERCLCHVAIPLPGQLHGNQADLLLKRDFDILESAAFYEGVRPVLGTLLQLSNQAELEMQEFTLPLPKYIVYADSESKPPAYLLQEDGNRKSTSVDFWSVITKAARQCGQYQAVPMLSGEWPPASCIALEDDDVGIDDAQYRALKSALTQEFAVIQGPPGTGKTYLGLIIMKLLLSNRHLWTEDNARGKCAPILFICYTNHALDQFLEELVKLNLVRSGRNDLIRVGGGSKSESLKPFMHHEYVKKQKKAEERHTTRLRLQCYRLQDELGAYREEYLAAQWCIIHERRLFEYDPDEMQSRLLSMGPQGPFGISAIAHWLDIFGGQGLNYLSQCHEKNDSEEKHSLSPEIELIFQEEYDLYGDENRIYVENDDECAAVDTNYSHSTSMPSAAKDIDIRQLEKYEPMDNWNPEDGQRHKEYVTNQIQENSDVMTDEEVAHRHFSDPFMLGHADRWRLYRKWRNDFCGKIISKIKALLPDYLRTVHLFKESKVDQDVDLFEKIKIFGMTTTGAAKYSSALGLVGPKIVLVEEAAEILESQVVASLGRHCQHLVQIGDHQQLRPSTNVYQLTKKFKLDISLFERAINAGMPHNTLQVQHRMRPEISGLLVPTIYERILDHDKVRGRPLIKGVDKSVFFLNHNVSEDHESHSTSHSNQHETSFLARFCLYLVQQGYEENEITILTAYGSQMFKVRAELKKGLRQLDKVKVTTIDNYQGEENRIVLLSLVRNNDEEKIGFLTSENRICVALSRAKEGFYAIGNFELFRKKSNTWAKILDKAKSQGFLGNKMVLKCHNHPDVPTMVQRARDFDAVQGGGCLRQCLSRLKCGHPCKHTCHAEDRNHETRQYTFCSRKCDKECKNRHKCHKKCWECTKGCECQVKVAQKIPKCGHIDMIPCFKDPADFECTKPCTMELQCGHICPNRCGQCCIATIECEQSVQAVLPCGHQQKVKCKERHSLADILCATNCTVTLPCGHTCSGSCGKCLQTLHQPCQSRCDRTLICQHQCPEPCTKACPPCKKPCQVRCDHSQCKDMCGQPCEPCRERCSWKCPHSRCRNQCSEKCSRSRCNKPCCKKLILECGCRQICIGVCGEPCPMVCVMHDYDKLTEVDEMYSLHDETRGDCATYMVLECNHVFETRWLDKYMASKVDNAREKNDEESPVQQVCCPLCRETITRLAGRYGNILRRVQANIDLVKKRVYSEWHLDQGVLTLEKTRLNRLLVSAFRRSAHQDSYVDKTLSAHIKKMRTRDDVAQIENRIHMSKAMSELHSEISSADRSSSAHDILEKFKIKTDFLSVTKWLSNLKVTKPAQASAFVTEIDNLRLRLKLCTILESLTQNGSYKSETDMEVDIWDIEVVLLKAQIGNERQKVISDETIQAMEGLVEKHKCHLSTSNAADKRMVVKAMNFPEQGHWYKCRKGHMYAITECGGATETAKCPECGAGIGGTKHRLLDDNQVATEMDGERHST